MNKKLNGRIKKALPENGVFDITFSITSPIKPGTITSTLALKIYKMVEVVGKEGNKEEKPSLISHVNVSGMGDSLNEAQENALDSALKLLGV